MAAAASGEGVSVGRAGAKTQIGALLKKNAKIHMRTNALPCCSCQCAGGCVPVSAGCMHVLCPVLFVAVTTAVPWLIINAVVSSESERKEFLEVQVEAPIIAKPYPGFGDTREPNNPYRLWDWGESVLAGSYQFYGVPGPYEGWVDRSFPTSPPFLTPLFEKKAKKSLSRWGDCEYYIESCHCQTLAIVGPDSVTADFKAFLEQRYDEWENASAAADSGWYSNGWPTVTNLWRALAYTDSRRMQEGATPPSRTRAGGSRFGPSREWLQPLSWLAEQVAKIGRGRRLTGDSDICDMYEEGASVHDPDDITQVACDVDAGKERPIFRVFSSADEVDDWIGRESYGRYFTDRSESSEMDRLCGAIVFDNDVLSSDKPAYTIRMNVSHEQLDVSSDFTSLDIDDEQNSPGALEWYYRGFLQAQYLVQRFIAEERTPGAQQDAGAWDLMSSEPHFIFPPSSEFRSWSFGDVVGFVLGNPLIMSAMFGPIVSTIAFYTSRERATRQRELMRMMGLSDSSLIASWLIMFVVLNLFITLCMSIFFIAFFFKGTDFIVVWTLLWFFANATTTLGMLVAGVVSSDRMAAMSAFGLFLGCSFTAIAIKPYDPQATKTLWSLIPSNAFVQGMEVIWRWEIRGLGATTGRASEKINNYSVGIAIGMLFLDFWLNLALYYYFDQVAPWHNVGVPRKPWFFFQASFWREVLGKPPVIPTGGIEAPEGDLERQTSGSLIESEEDEHLKSMVQNKKCVIIQDLSKRFRNASGHEIVAVNSLSLTMYQDECFCLLGHNGAGKTTTMMMLTGCMPQSGGTIEVKGVKIPEGIRAIRSSMGFCPQHNVLIDELTVMEHLELFGTIGGMTRSALEARGRELLVAVALADKREARSTALSGGMKRKLSCALAFLAEPYLVILDEPSSGMDPFARRGMWDTLKRWRTGHILCLTTHYMDEADALGDRVAIMGEGRLVCSGSSTFLKKKFGLGYIISFAKYKEGATQDTMILHAIKEVISDVEIMSSVGKELLVQVPFAAAVHFARLFSLLDSKQGELGIESYGTSITNLEEVFLRVAKLEKAEKRAQSNADLGEAAALQERPDVEIKQAGFFLQVYALLLRRVLFGYRNRLSCACQICLPMMCLLLFCILTFASTTLALPSLLMAPTDWNVDVENGPRVPVTVGVDASLSESDFESLWQGDEDAEAYTVSVAAESWPGAAVVAAYYGYTPHDVLLGVAQEAGFVKQVEAREDALEASQYGAIFYPKTSSWCPAEHAWGDGNSSDGLLPIQPLCEAGPGPTVAGNMTSRHSPAIVYNLHGGAVLRKRTGGAVSGLQVKNHPFQQTLQAEERLVFVTGIFASIVIMASYGFIPAGATSYVVMEKERDVKNQLIISGCSHLAYWVSNILFDIFWGLIPCIGAQVVFHAFGIDYFIKSPGFAASVALFLGYLPAAAGFAYLTGFMFSKAGVALFASWIFYMLFGILSTTLISVLEIFANSLNGARVAAEWLRWIFRLVPIYSLGSGHLSISLRQLVAKQEGIGALAGVGVGGAKCPTREELGLDSNDVYNKYWYCTYMVGDEFMVLLVSAVLFFFAAVALDVVTGMPFFKKMFSIPSKPAQTAGQSLEDSDVLDEKARVKGLDVSKQFVFVDDVHKVYKKGKVHAVKGISFAADEGQVFGLLGVNGAGKTTTFKMLCGQVEPSAGRVCIQGYDITTQAAEARRLIGYCPQFDALLDSLTTKEHLELYGHLKGLSSAQLDQAVQQQLQDLDLTSYVYSRAGQLSGGNKRKTSVAMATIGEPPMVFLDEPSAGMDPVARRGMWSVIQNIAEKRKKSVVILTTHSMEEAEALCSRIAIQVDGQFRCLGSAQHIKSRYGQGLELNVRLATPSPSELQECCKKLVGAENSTDNNNNNPRSSTDVLDVSAAEASIQRSFDGGAELVREIGQRPGSPFQSKTVEVNLLAEWVLLVQCTQAFENWLVRKLQEEAATSEPVVVGLEKSQNVIRYQILPVALAGKYKSLGELFNLFQQNKGTLKLEDFQVCQPSLEQVFNRFATTQTSQANSQRQPAAVAAAADPEATKAAMTKPTPGQDVSEFLVDNSQLKAPTPGLGYRTAKDLTALANPNVFVGAAWGSVVQGVKTSDGWLQVGQWFLPLEVQGTMVIVPSEGSKPNEPAAQVIGVSQRESL